MSIGYQAARLDDVLTKSDDSISIEPNHIYQQVTVRMWGQGVVERNRVTGVEIAASRRQVIRTGQFIVSRIDARHGALGLVPPTLDGAVVSNDFPIFSVIEDRLDPRYLDWLSKTRDFVDLCRRASEGTTNRVRLKEERFLAMEITLPPLDEQRRIVARIEELAAKVEEARRLRRQLATEVDALGAAHSRELFAEIRDGAIGRVEEFAEVRGGIQKHTGRAPGANPRRYITVAHVQRNRIDTSDPRYFEVSDIELERWRLQPGDVLVIEGNGSADQIGRSALFRGEIEDCVHQNHVIRVRPDPSRVAPEYLNAYFNSPTGRDEMLERSRTTSGLFNLSVGRIKSIEVPVPALDDQRAMIFRLHRMQERLTALKGDYARTATELDALQPAILDRAFRGDL